MELKEQIKRIQEKYLRWQLGLNWRTPRYLVRKELQREKLRTRASKGEWKFEERLAEGKESELARRCWEKMRKRVKRGGKLWREKRKDEFF